MLDYVSVSGKEYYYVCPARKGARPGRIAPLEWTLSSSPCIFLDGNLCAIERVKPRGGREFFCYLVTQSKENVIFYGKERAAMDWRGRRVLSRLLIMAKDQGDTKFVSQLSRLSED